MAAGVAVTEKIWYNIMILIIFEVTDYEISRTDP
jgi:hypothetical protein